MHPTLSSDLLAPISEAAALPAASGQLVDRLQASLGAAWLAVVDCELPAGRVTGARQSGAGAPEHAQGWQPWIERLLALPEGEVLHDAGAAPLRSSAGALLGVHFRHGVGRATAVLAGGEPLRPARAAMLRELVPHLRHAARLREMVRQHCWRAGTELLRQLPVPCALADRDGRCIDSNEGFRTVAGRAGLRTVTGRLRLPDPERQSEWEQALWETHATGVGQTMEFAVTPLQRYVLRLQPFLAAVTDDATRERLLLVGIDEYVALAGGTQRTQAMQRLRGRLTPAEMDVLASVLAGVPAKSIAANRGASIYTVRSQIVSILDKTGFRSQRELLASLGGGASSGWRRESS